MMHLKKVENTIYKIILLLFLMTYWQTIHDTILLPSTQIVYIGIGSAMEHYIELTEENNQQYPCFLNKFGGNKVIILIDPVLEHDLKIQTYFNLIENPLRMINIIKNDMDAPIFRHFQNYNTTVFAINDWFYLEALEWMPSDKITQTNENIAILLSIINTCLEKQLKTKLIVQDYVGRDNTKFYLELFNIWNKEDVLNNILFDVSQRNEGCFIKLSPNIINIDSDKNFIQEKYMSLVDIKDSSLFIPIIVSRIDQLIFPLSKYYQELNLTPTLLKPETHAIKYLSNVYNITCVDNSHEYLVTYYEKLIKVMINDIVDSRDADPTIKDYLFENILNRDVFISTISVFKFD